MSSLRHGNGTAAARAGFPDSVRTIVIGHTRAIGERAAPVDTKLPAYSRQLLVTLEDQIKVSRFFAYPATCTCVRSVHHHTLPPLICSRVFFNAIL